MRYNFANSTRLVMNQAREEALGLRHDYVGVEHILLGLLSDDSVTSQLTKLGATADAIRRDIRATCLPGRSAGVSGELPYTSRAKRVLEQAVTAAAERGDSAVEPRHLLIAVLMHEKGIGAMVLRNLGVTLENGEPAREFTIRIDDGSDRSIYEQIVAQITEGVATGALYPGKRLPTVRQLADDLDVAPGTVARAYGELERQGLVATEGSRGTRIADRVAAPDPFLDRPAMLIGLLRPSAVAAFHLGATGAELRVALEEAMKGIFVDRPDQPA